MIELALQAQLNSDARQVLGDAVLESGWWDPRVQHLIVGFVGRRSARTNGRRNWRWFQRQAAQPTEEWARAVLSVLLFEGMQSTPWPGPQRPKPTARDLFRIMREIYPQERISELAYESSPFLRLIQKEQSAVMSRMARDFSTMLYGDPE